MASSVAQPLERQIAQIPGVSQMTSTSSLGATAITVQFDLDRNIDAAANDVQAAINAAAGQLPKNLPSPPTYRKVNPSDTPILILSVAVRRRADHRRRRRRREHPRPAHQPDLRRVAGARRRPADAGDPHPDRSRPSSSRRTCSSRTSAAQIGIGDGRQPQGLDHRRQAGVHHLRQRPAHHRQALERRHRRLSQRRAGARARHRPGGRRPRRRRRRRAWSNGKRERLPRRLQAARRQRHQDRRERSSRRCTSSQASIPPTIHVKVLSDRTTTIRASVDDVAVHAAADDRARRHGDLRLPAQRLGDDHPERHRAARAARRDAR